MPHPWHDVMIGDEAPEEFTALIWRIRSRASLFGGARCCGHPIAHAKATGLLGPRGAYHPISRI